MNHTLRPADAPGHHLRSGLSLRLRRLAAHPQGLAPLPASAHGTEVAIVGAGMAGMTAAYELMKLGLKPVIYEASRMGGRLRSQPFEGGQGVVAELGGMRFPASSTAFFHYVKLLGLETSPSPTRSRPPPAAP
jgi:lysine 2-monooxygenase